VFIPVDDRTGQLGRSKARNLGVELARTNEIEWIFFLDADDLMVEEAFKTLTPYVTRVDALWGLICETDFFDLSRITVRNNQVRTIADFGQILTHDPFLTLQMGHFVRSNVAALYPFDETMNTGEDFKYYLSVWQHHRCLKTDAVLFVNRRGNHASGPKSANGRDWRLAVDSLLAETRNHGNTIGET
jgi:glycosyltransferase involved in cell wall biosynthesis